MTSSEYTTHRCPDCGQTFPLSAEYFPRSKGEKSGFVCYCKACWRKRSAAYKASKRPPTVPIPDGYRVCAVCITLLPATREFFTANPKGKDGLQSFCKNCGAASQRQYRADHPDRIKAMEKKRNGKPERRAKSHAYYWKNPEKSRRQKREYAKRHPDRVRATSQRIRAKRLGAVGEYSGHDLLLLFKQQGGKCWWCGCKIKRRFEVDHRVPLSRGGTNEVGNLAISCVRCNRSKHNKLPGEWNGRLL